MTAPRIRLDELTDDDLADLYADRDTARAALEAVATVLAQSHLKGQILLHEIAGIVAAAS